MFWRDWLPGRCSETLCGFWKNLVGNVEGNSLDVFLATSYELTLNSFSRVQQNFSPIRFLFYLGTSDKNIFFAGSFLACRKIDLHSKNPIRHSFLMVLTTTRVRAGKWPTKPVKNISFYDSSKSRLIVWDARNNNLV